MASPNRPVASHRTMATPEGALPVAADADAEPAVEVDSDDADSAYGDDGLSSSGTSLRSSIMQYEWKHGRRYHSYQAGVYSFPNDEREQDRLDMVHHVFYRLLGDRLFLAPLDPNGLRVLDIGTGTGIWPIQLGDEYPGADVVGNDLSPIQPSWVPTNVRFLVDDVELDWASPERYDFIHCRYMAASIADWPRLFAQMYESLAPGGWVELHESDNALYSDDGSLAPDNPILELMHNLSRACGAIGRILEPAPHFAGWAAAAGFERVREQRFKLPVGAWPKEPRLKEIGAFMNVSFSDGVEAFTAVLLRDVLGWSHAAVEVMNSRVRAATRRRDVHALFDVLVVTAQKPLRPTK